VDQALIRLAAEIPEPHLPLGLADRGSGLGQGPLGAPGRPRWSRWAGTRRWPAGG
jgi:hypothetical protein